MRTWIHLRLGSNKKSSSLARFVLLDFRLAKILCEVRSTKHRMIVCGEKQNITTCTTAAFFVQKQWMIRVAWRAGEEPSSTWTIHNRHQALKQLAMPLFYMYITWWENYWSINYHRSSLAVAWSAHFFTDISPGGSENLSHRKWLNSDGHELQEIIWEERGGFSNKYMLAGFCVFLFYLLENPLVCINSYNANHSS